MTLPDIPADITSVLPDGWFTQRRTEQLAALCGGKPPSSMMTLRQRFTEDGSPLLDEDGDPQIIADIHPLLFRAAAQVTLEAAGHGVGAEDLLDEPPNRVMAWAKVGINAYQEALREDPS